MRALCSRRCGRPPRRRDRRRAMAPHTMEASRAAASRRFGGATRRSGRARRLSPRSSILTWRTRCIRAPTRCHHAVNRHHRAVNQHHRADLAARRHRAGANGNADTEVKVDEVNVDAELKVVWILPPSRLWRGPAASCHHPSRTSSSSSIPQWETVMGFLAGGGRDRP